MNYLFVHKNFPAQFIHLVNYLRRIPTNKVVFLTENTDSSMADVIKVQYKSQVDILPSTHCYLRSFEKAVNEGLAAVKEAIQLRQQGFVPDVIIGHSGFGPTLYLKDVFPKARLVGMFEWFYRAYGSDVDFDGDVTPDIECSMKLRNAPIVLDLAECDCGYTPTMWQHSQFPIEYASKIAVIHDGVDTEFCKPNGNARTQLPDDLKAFLEESSEVVTYVSRGFEEYRGFPQFMRALKIVLQKRPRCRAIIVGQDKVFYGRKLDKGQTFKEKMLAELDIDSSRIFFTGPLPKPDYLRIIQISDAHIYLTKPFVLSWSLLEAMACGCKVIASKTKPVEEVIVDGINGLLADFFTPVEIADKTIEALESKNKYSAMGVRARDTVVQRFDLKMMLPKQLQLIHGR